MLLRRRLDLRRRLSEGVPIGRIIRYSVPQIVEQDAQLSVILRIGNQQVNAGPVEIRRWRRGTSGYPDALDFKCCEELDEPTLKTYGHLSGVGLEKKLGQRPVDRRSDWGLLAQDNGVTVPSKSDRIFRGPTAWVLEDENPNRERRLQILLSQNLTECVAELLQADQSLPPGPRPRIRKHLEWPPRIFHPGIRGKHQGHYAEKKKRSTHHPIIPRLNLPEAPEGDEAMAGQGNSISSLRHSGLRIGPMRSDSPLRRLPPSTASKPPHGSRNCSHC